jgi:ribonuclease-3
MDAVSNILNEVITPRLENPDDIGINSDYKTKLQEYVQADSKRTVHYEVIRTSGPSNQPTFEINVMLDELTLGRGIGSSKKTAEQEAAKDALKKLVK